MNHHVPCSGVPPDDLLDLIYHYKALLIRQLHLCLPGGRPRSINAKAVMIPRQAESKAAGGMKEIRSPTNSPFPPTSQHTFIFRTEEHECYLLARTDSKGCFIAQPMCPFPEECEFPAKSMK